MLTIIAAECQKSQILKIYDRPCERIVVMKIVIIPYFSRNHPVLVKFCTHCSNAL